MQPTVHSSQNPPLWRHANPLAVLATLWRHRELIVQLTRREIAARYKGSHLGLLWALVTPLFMLAVYAFVFGGGIFESKWESISGSRFECAVTIFCGLILYNIFSETVNVATRVVVMNANYVKKVVFPLEVLPVVTLGAALVQAALSGLVFLLGLVLLVAIPPVTILLFPLVLLSLCAFTLGLAWLLAALGVFLRDINHTVQILTQAIFFCSAVFFPVSALSKELRWLVYLNPVAILIDQGRNAIIFGHAPDWPTWGIMTAIALLVMQGGYMTFMASKRAFSDVL